MLMLKTIRVVKLIRNCRYKCGTNTAKSLKYEKFGEPESVLKEVEETLTPPEGREVLVKILAAPVNPADINTVQGKYPVKIELPAVGGNEFVGEIMHVGPLVKKLKYGDRVVPSKTGIGSWRTMGKFCEYDVEKISKEIGLAEAATITVNPCTAYRMLKDFVVLKRGDSVILNGANSSVGQFVVQLCKAWNLNAVGVIRSSDTAEEIKDFLKCMGAAEVLTEEELRKTEIFKGKKPCFPKPKLGLNCIGGKSSSELARHLANNATMVTYGGMSKQPVMIPTGNLIFKDLIYRGFWMTRWANENTENIQRKMMFEDIIHLMKCGELHASSHTMIPFKEYKKAMTLEAKTKYILDMKDTSKK